MSDGLLFDDLPISFNPDSKDWTGGYHSMFVTNGCSNHTDVEREDRDYYATDPKAVELLLEKETFSNVWECAAGGKHISNVLRNHGITVRDSDIVDRTGDIEVLDFLKCNCKWGGGDIITNPPYKNAAEFVQKSLEVIDEGRKVAMFLKLTFLEGKQRRKMFDKYPPKVVYVFSSRFECFRNGDFSKSQGSAVAYAWYVWVKGFAGEPVIRWIA